ncbi:TetR/AcrR family transcriptional regulator [Kribbella kalugense]|uniref:TetR family transcriptional regulator n=1 Tax=Kribbella kalugense TaxID=2512221 RepID=A0A4R7ZWH9_9ACTN|nr:TetR/AcrR family transcriptional regulator [Kribbella kalugense]TDW22439.1 TetR family transcriptional regulator [Kribbella kalugense]
MEQAQRRRGAELEAVLLDAAWDELMETGYTRLTMEAVAARAHTGKQVLYRRWRNRAELVVAAMRHRTGSIVGNVPDTGSLRADVLAVLQRMADRFETLGPEVVHGLLAEAPDLDPEVYTRMAGVMATIVKRAAERGEIPTADVPDRVLTAATNLLRHEMLFAGEPVAPSTLTSLVDDVFLPLVSGTRERSE